MTAGDNNRSTSDNSIPEPNGTELNARDDPRLIRIVQYVYSQDSRVTTESIAQQFALDTDDAKNQTNRLIDNGFALCVGDSAKSIGLTVKGKRLAKRGMDE